MSIISSPSHVIIIFLGVLLRHIVRIMAMKAPTKVLVIGGSGRVGGSAVRALEHASLDSLSITVGGRYEENFESIVRRHNLGKDVTFQAVDVYSESNLRSILPSYDLIIHTAGPFQGLESNIVLNVCMEMGKKYLDVCDDIHLSRVNRRLDLQTVAQKTGGSAIISTGIWPGASSLLARKVIEAAGGAEEVEDVKFSFFTAGSGGAGRTILTATFLLLGEDVQVYRDGQIEFRKTSTDPVTVDFGPLGKRTICRLNLIECESCAVYLSTKGRTGGFNVETRFGTAPAIWNRLFAVMAKLVPQHLLQNRRAMNWFAAVSLPMVRLVDSLVGSQNGIRVDVRTAATSTRPGSTWTGVLSHDDLEKSVGDAICAFALQSIKGTPSPGVWFPEEVESQEYVNEVLDYCAQDAVEYYIRKGE